MRFLDLELPANSRGLEAESLFATTYLPSVFVRGLGINRRC